MALAQMCGSLIVPVAFSFGFVSYSFKALLSAVSGGRLMPSSDIPSTVMNLKSGYSRTNQSWILGRLLRDAESSLEPKSKTSFSVSVYKAHGPGGVVHFDWLWYHGVAVIILQCGIALVPLILYLDWTILMMTVIGNILALASGAIPQWAREKWACRRTDSGRYCLFRGNGHKHVVIIFNTDSECLNLEDLAGAQEHPHPTSKIILSVLAMSWILFLINVAGLQDHHWYFLAVGFLGMVQNVFVAGAPREPSAFGIHLDLIECFQDGKVMRVLQSTEEAYPGTASHLVKTFFPGGLRPDEEEIWVRLRLTAADRKAVADQKQKTKASAENETISRV